MANKKKVLFIRGSKAASGFYRMALPCLALQEKGYITDIIDYNTIDPVNLIGTKEVKGKQIGYDLTKSDVVIFQLVVYEALIRVIEKLKAKKILTVMETDDDYLHLNANSPSFRSFHPKTLLMKDANGKDVFNIFKERVNPALENMLKAMRQVDMLQVSTPELKENYSVFNKNIVVLENCIDTQMYKLERPKNKKPVIMWAGTKTHLDDLYQVNGCMPENCKLIIAGFPEVKDEGLFTNHPNVKYLAGVKFEEYPKLINKADIVMIPLKDSKFNACKSDIKGLEFGALGIPCVASDVAPYRRWIDHGSNGFLVKGNKTKFWIRYLQQLVDDENLRLKMGQAAKDKAMWRDIRNQIYKWEEVYFND